MERSDWALFNSNRKKKEKTKRDNFVNDNEKLFKKLNIEFENHNTLENIICINTLIDNYLLSLKTLKTLIGGKWIIKYKKTILTKNDSFTFGKYKDETVQYVLETDSKYLIWLNQSTSYLVICQ